MLKTINDSREQLEDYMEINKLIINNGSDLNNYSNKVKFERNASAIIKIEKDQEEAYKIKNQYACFNILDSSDGKSEYILPYYNKDTCETMYDEYGKTKPISSSGIPAAINAS